jgi:Na+-translocating ferredoxin:NAD+ oxidoreductase RnfC subunit
MEYENKYASKGVAGAGLGTGIAGLSLGVLNAMGNGGLLNGVLGGNCRTACPDGIPVNRYEAEQSARIAQLETQVALRDANTYSDQKMAAMNDRYNDRFTAIERRLAESAVIQQKTEDSILMVNERIDCVRDKIMAALCRETDERKCADNAMVNYMNATFYPKMVADVTTGTTTTAQTVYNPLPIQCGKCCG